MEWTNYTTKFQACKRSAKGTEQRLLRELGEEKWTAWIGRQRAEGIDHSNHSDVWMMAFFRLEYDWIVSGKPFYNMWPSIVPALSSVDISKIPASALKELFHNVPPNLVLKFARGHEPQVSGVGIRSVLTSCIALERRQKDENGNIDTTIDPTKLDDGLAVLIDVGDYIEDDGSPHPELLRVAFNAEEGKTIGECWNKNGVVGSRSGYNVPFDHQGGKDLQKFVIQLVIGLMMMAKDPELVSPVVLSKDRLEFERTGDEKYVEKARRKGILGHDVGREVEMSPHYRRSHFAIRWTGKGRKIPKLVAVKGCVVKREKLKEVPSGHDEVE